MKMTSPTGNRRSNLRRARAFTLVELMLVMAILIMVVALVTPMLSNFFAGRTLDSEARRVLSLTRYGQSRAVSEGVPMMLWVDPRNGTYGLEQEQGYTDGDPKAVDFKLGKDLKIDVAKGVKTTGAGTKALAIHFSPDGTVESANSVTGISLQEGSSRPVWILPSANQVSYEIQDQNGTTPNIRR